MRYLHLGLLSLNCCLNEVCNNFFHFPLPDEIVMANQAAELKLDVEAKWKVKRISNFVVEGMPAGTI